MGEPEVWTIQKIISWTTGHFAAKKIESARLDAEVLLSHLLKCKRLDLYLNFDKPMKPDELTSYREMVRRRSTREPVAYIVAEQEFYGRPFIVGPGCLIPRPETELLVEEVKKLEKKPETTTTQTQTTPPPLAPESYHILDIGTGSGCIGLTLAQELKGSHTFTLLEKSQEVLKYVQSNFEKFDCDKNNFGENKINIIEGDFENFAKATENQGRYDIVVSNPPYISLSDKNTLSQDVVGFEPHDALFGGEVGIETTSIWLAEVLKVLKPGGKLFFEIGFDQKKTLLKLFEQENLSRNFEDIEVKKDYSNHDRILCATRKP